MPSDDKVFVAYSVDHASRVTGLSKSRLTRWDNIGFFSPELTTEEDRGSAYGRVYSYTDLVGLRTLAILADVHKVPLSELKKAHDLLVKSVDKPWSDISLSVLKRKVVTDLKGQPRNVTDGQAVIKEIPLPSIASEVADKARQLRERNKELLGTTEKHKFIAHNAVVVAGTRIPISAIKSYIDAGYSDPAIIAEYPTLTKIDMQFVRERLRQAA
jgi:uncharacterized protein (DUF433 family)